MKAKKVIIISLVSILIAAGLVFICVSFDLNNLTTAKISTDAEIAHLDDLKDSYIETYKDLYDFDKKQIVFVRFNLNNKSFYTLKNVKLNYNSDYDFERIGVPDLQDGGEVIGNPRFDNEFVVPFVIGKEINENDFLKSLKYEFCFSVFNKSFSLTN